MANLQIKIDDDKKQKWQSFTASVNLELPHLFNSEVEAYGADEKEATENLMAMLSDIATDVNKKLKKLDNGEPSGYMLDGVPIEEVTKANLRLETNDDGKVSGFRLDGVEAMTSSDGSVTFYADKLYEVNPQTGEKVEITPRMMMRNGDDVVAVDDYVNDKYLYKK